MKGRPVTGEEFDRMIECNGDVVGKEAAESWTFALRVLWNSGFRIGDQMDFAWDDDRHIRPHWPQKRGQLPTITVPSSQKNGRVQEIPMLPELDVFLQSVPKKYRTGWIVNPKPIHVQVKPGTR